MIFNNRKHLSLKKHVKALIKVQMLHFIIIVLNTLVILLNIIVLINNFKMNYKQIIKILLFLFLTFYLIKFHALKMNVLIL